MPDDCLPFFGKVDMICKLGHPLYWILESQEKKEGGGWGDYCYSKLANLWAGYRSHSSNHFLEKDRRVRPGLVFPLAGATNGRH